MDYKEKYEQALDNLKKIKAASKDNKELVDFIEFKYPELKESEDEIIRKELIDFVNQYGDKFYGQVAKASVIAWTEKQDPNRFEEEIELAYKTADEVQYRNGFKAGQNEVLENPQKYSLEKQGSDLIDDSEILQ